MDHYTEDNRQAQATNVHPQNAYEGLLIDTDQTESPTKHARPTKKKKMELPSRWEEMMTDR